MIVASTTRFPHICFVIKTFKFWCMAMTAIIVSMPQNPSLIFNRWIHFIIDTEQFFLTADFVCETMTKLQYCTWFQSPLKLFLYKLCIFLQDYNSQKAMVDYKTILGKCKLIENWMKITLCQIVFFSFAVLLLNKMHQSSR